jgi:hypothetical protein
VLAAGILALLYRGEDSWIPVLDSANLAFHEAGHLVYGVFGETAGLYGGVLGQLTFPLVAIGAFYVRRDATGLAVGAIWAAQNLFNIARYMADARAQELPLVGGGDHDFARIFTRWDVLHRDVQIASDTRVIAWLVIAVTLAWLAWRHRATTTSTSVGEP